MTRLLPGQRLWPRSYHSQAFGEPATVLAVRRAWATVRNRSGEEDVAAEDGDDRPGQHLTRGDWPTTYYTDEARVRSAVGGAVHRSRRDINAALDRCEDLDTLNRVRVALGLPEVTVWAPPPETP